jgi:GNAT superfamily N-acetyltransferase
MAIRFGNISSDERETEAVLRDLVAVLRDSIANNYSVGFLTTDSEASLREFWISELERPSSIVLCAWLYSEIIGTVIITRETRSNGRHRGELRKLMVLSTHQGSGIGSKLEKLACVTAKETGISLLYLDSATDFLVNEKYEAWGWQRVGSIPNYAAEPSGNLVATTYFYKEL